MKILFIGAHPDDIEFGCGGSLCRFAKAGHEIHIFIMTAGGVGGKMAVRRKEQQKSADMLGATLHWGQFDDTRIPVSRELIEAVENKIAEINPELVFTHFPEDTHQDHRAVSQAVVTACRYVSNVLFFEGPTTLNFLPTVFMGIDGLLPEKLRLLGCHRSQVNRTHVTNLSIMEMAKSTAIFRGYQYRVKFAEGFVAHRFSLDCHLRPEK